MALVNRLESLEKMNEQIEKLRIWTSSSNEDRFQELAENEILPIIIIGISKYSPLFKWRNTMIHFIDLGPEPDLWKSYIENMISDEEFQRKYLNYLWRTSDVFKILERFEILTHLSHSQGVCLLGSTSEKPDITRKTLAEYFNRLGVLENTVEEWNP